MEFSFELVVLVFVGFIAGAINILAGGGSLLTLPILIFLAALTGTIPIDSPKDSITTLKMLLRDIGFKEIEINPLRVFEIGALALDVRVRV